MKMANLTKEDIRSVIETIKELYLEDMIPWICGYSGGKDSTAVVQLVWYALQELPKEKLKKTVHVISTDTLVESPVVAIWATESLKKMEQTAKEQGLPIVPHRLTPAITNTFWVNLIGRGYPYPRRDFRWCTDRMKIDTSNRFIKSINDVLVGHIPESAAKETIKNMSATSMMLYQRLIAEVFQSITQRIDSLVNHVDAQESELMSLDAHLGAADEKTLAMQLFDALKSVEGEKALADAEYQRQLDSIESLKRQREMLVAKRIQLIKAIAEKEQANDDNARIVKYAAMSIEVLREFKVRLQREKVAKLSSTATKCFRELVEKDSLVSEIKIDPTTLDVTILDLDGNELLKSQLSAGEQQMFAVAIVWALALTSGYKAPVIIDTPMARLDSSHRANFVTKYLPAASSQVMVLSTDEEVYGRYLDLVRDNVVDYYTLLYREEEQCTSIVHGYFGEV